MTSEVLVLNKRAVVIAADSAITSSKSGGQPRYSKSATKIFDLTDNGHVGAAFFGNALLDSVPWEVVVKQYRTHLGEATFASSEEYLLSLTGYMTANPRFFPKNMLASQANSQFDSALLQIVQYARKQDPSIFDSARELGERQALWATVVDQTRNLLGDDQVVESLSVESMQASIQEADWVDRAREQLKAPELDAIDPVDLTELAQRLRYCRPWLLCDSSGLVVAGYGEEEIFPSFHRIEVYCHVGNELAFSKGTGNQITHSRGAAIQPLAHTSMIDMFTDGFDSSLQTIIDNASKKALTDIISDLRAQGIDIATDVQESIVERRHDAFMQEWKRENWAQNFTPLLTVIATLDVQEMAHLAETLLVLESLKERVTSPTEEVGGPIDVAVITKSEGLVWIKRKHYFTSDINMRYTERVRRSYAKRVFHEAVAE